MARKFRPFLEGARWIFAKKMMGYFHSRCALNFEASDQKHIPSRGIHRAFREFGVGIACGAALFMDSARPTLI